MKRLLPMRILPAILLVLPPGVVPAAAREAGHGDHRRPVSVQPVSAGHDHHAGHSGAARRPSAHDPDAGHAEATSAAPDAPGHGHGHGHDGHANHATTSHGAHDHAPAPAPAQAPHGTHAQRASHAHVTHDDLAPAATPPHDHAAHAMPQAHGAAPAQPAPREPIPHPTDADRAAAFPPLRHGHAHGGGINSLVRFDRLEGWDADPGTGQAWEAKAWVGGDVQRLWLRSEGEREDGRTLAADLEVFYGRGISPWWDLLAGVRHDFAPGDSRTWAALGVQGMAPYKFEVAATAYLGSGGRTALRAEVEYELPLTRRLLLQPKLELELHGRDDVRRGIGTGLSTAEAGVRLRWAATPRFAPYFGVVHERSFGDTRRYRAAEHGQARDTHWVAGLRWWF